MHKMRFLIAIFLVTSPIVIIVPTRAFYWLLCGFIAQLVEHRTGIAEVTGSNPVEALIFFRLLLSDCLNWKIYCDYHSLLSPYFNACYCSVAGKFENKKKYDVSVCKQETSLYVTQTASAEEREPGNEVAS